MGQPLAGTLRTGMCRYQLIVAGVDLHFPCAATSPQLLPDQAEGGRIIRLVKDKVAISMQLDSLPYTHIVRCPRQWTQHVPLYLESFQGSFAGGAVNPMPRRGIHPAQHVSIGLIEGRGRSSPQEVALDVVNAPLLHFPFMLWGARITGRDQKTIVLCALAIGALRFWHIPTYLGDPRLQVVDANPLRRAAEEINRSQVSSFWSKTNSTYWWRLQDRVITNTQVLRSSPVSESSMRPA
jgi:hypothetical protein